MNKRLALGIFYELIWVVIAVVAAVVLIFPYRHDISFAFMRYLFCALFLVFTYFRFVAFMMRSVVLENVWVKLGLFILNFPLFFLMLNKYFDYIDVFNEYNYTLATNVFQHIKSGTDVEELLYLKRLTIFSGIISMMMIVLLQLRIVYAIFKLRQFDKYL